MKPYDAGIETQQRATRRRAFEHAVDDTPLDLAAPVVFAAPVKMSKAAIRRQYWSSVLNEYKRDVTL